MKSATLTPAEAAERIGSSRSSVYRYIKLPNGLHAEHVGRRLFINVAELDRFIDERTAVSGERPVRGETSSTPPPDGGTSSRHPLTGDSKACSTGQRNLDLHWRAAHPIVFINWCPL